MRNNSSLDFKNHSKIKHWLLSCMVLIMCITACKGKAETDKVDINVTGSFITPKEFWSTIQEKESQIDILNQGVDDAAKHYNVENMEYWVTMAFIIDDPNFYMEYNLARYNKAVSILIYAASDIAGEIAEIMRCHQNDYYLVSDIFDEYPPEEVLASSLAKYSDMRDFCLEHADKGNTRYVKFLEKYNISNLGEISKEDLESDNDFLRQYGVTIDCP